MQELRAGDCDDMTILLAAMLKAIGHPVRLALVGFNPHRKALFTVVVHTGIPPGSDAGGLALEFQKTDYMNAVLE